MDNEHIDKHMLMMETNLDDMPGEWMGYVLDRLFEFGAKDAYYTPIYMKKNRPAQKLSVLIDQKDLARVKSFLFQETTTLGVRYYPVTCHRLERAFVKVLLAGLGEVAVKIGRHEGEVVQISPEYEDCKVIAKRTNIPLKELFQRVKDQVFADYPDLK
jgi:pyridinium-3,5-bisthiocarboxylic acid mononucleotide nickel chelatase